MFEPSIQPRIKCEKLLLEKDPESIIEMDNLNSVVEEILQLKQTIFNVESPIKLEVTFLFF